MEEAKLQTLNQIKAFGTEQLRLYSEFAEAYESGKIPACPSV
ncbi:MAG: hypothetical protein Q8L02_04895 [Candidatus Nitrotoga sp.]|nr:hypothetical protein [Candidatus Nitrotoga sp.]